MDAKEQALEIARKGDHPDLEYVAMYADDVRRVRHGDLADPALQPSMIEFKIVGVQQSVRWNVSEREWQNDDACIVARWIAERTTGRTTVHTRDWYQIPEADRRAVLEPLRRAILDAGQRVPGMSAPIGQAAVADFLTGCADGPDDVLGYLQKLETDYLADAEDEKARRAARAAAVECSSPRKAWKAARRKGPMTIDPHNAPALICRDEVWSELTVPAGVVHYTESEHDVRFDYGVIPIVVPLRDDFPISRKVLDELPGIEAPLRALVARYLPSSKHTALLVRVFVLR